MPTTSDYVPVYPTRSDYTFTGYAESASKCNDSASLRIFTVDNAGKYTYFWESLSAAESKTYYACWESDATTVKYTATFMAATSGGEGYFVSSGTFQQITPCTVTSGTSCKVHIPTDPIWENHTFKGWYTSPTGGTKVTVGTDGLIELTKNEVYYAQWDDDTPQQTEKCWHCDVQTGNAYTWSTRTTSDCTDVTSTYPTQEACLRANQNTEKYELTIDPNGGILNGLNSVAYTDRVTKAELDSKVSRDGCTVDYWLDRNMNKELRQYADKEQHGHTLVAQWSCTSEPPTTDPPTTEPDPPTTEPDPPTTEPDAPFEVIDKEGCYKNKKIHVLTCQAESVEGAVCKIENGTVLRKDIRFKGACGEIDDGPGTGTGIIAVSWILGVMALIVSFYYFKKRSFLND